MLDLYKYHTAPDTLHEFESRWKLSPRAAVSKLVVDPNNEQALALVLSENIAILEYVRRTKKPFPAGLKAMGDKVSDLVSYAFALKQRVPQVEQVLLRGDNLNDLTYYVRHIIKGPWKEAESVIAKDDYYAREYVNEVLGGDWSKFDNGQYNTSAKWQDLIEDIINTIVMDVNDNGWAMEEEDEDNEPWDEIKLTFVRTNADKTTLKVMRDGRLTGKIVKADGEHVAKCYNADGKLITTVDLGQSEDDITQDLWTYASDDLAG
jgi:hypothetical protein